MKTIQLELSDTIYDRVIGILELLPKTECRILIDSLGESKELRQDQAFSVQTDIPSPRDETYADILR